MKCFAITAVIATLVAPLALNAQDVRPAPQVVDWYDRLIQLGLEPVSVVATVSTENAPNRAAANLLRAKYGNGRAGLKVLGDENFDGFERGLKTVKTFEMDLIDESTYRAKVIYHLQPPRDPPPILEYFCCKESGLIEADEQGRQVTLHKSSSGVYADLIAALPQKLLFELLKQTRILKVSSESRDEICLEGQCIDGQGKIEIRLLEAPLRVASVSWHPARGPSTDVEVTEWQGEAKSLIPKIVKVTCRSGGGSVYKTARWEFKSISKESKPPATFQYQFKKRMMITDERTGYHFDTDDVLKERSSSP